MNTQSMTTGAFCPTEMREAAVECNLPGGKWAARMKDPAEAEQKERISTNNGQAKRPERKYKLEQHGTQSD